MSIVGGLDLHRKQVTFDLVDTGSGEVRRGRVCPADREVFRRWLARFDGLDVELAVEGCTGWRFVVEECVSAGVGVHLAEPADVAALKGRRKHAKTDRLDARHLRELLEAGALPECWVPPVQMLEVRALVRLYHDLMQEREAWQQRIHATLFHHGAPAAQRLLGVDRSWLQRMGGVSRSGRLAISVALRAIEALEVELGPVRAELVGFARRQPGCRCLQAEYGIGPLTSVVIWAELGDARRFRNSRSVVRHTGLDISVYSSDGKRSRGHLTRQGPALLRWALYESALCAARANSPDHAYYLGLTGRLGKKRAVISVARKLARRCYHRLVDLGDQALATV